MNLEKALHLPEGPGDKGLLAATQTILSLCLIGIFPLSVCCFVV